MITPLFEQEAFTINIQQDQRHLLLAELEEGNIDMIFTDNKDTLSSGVDVYRVGLNRTFVVAHKKYKKNIKNFPDCLNEIPFFNYTGETKLKYEIELFFAQNNITPKIIGQAEDIDLFQVITEKGLAFTIVPEVAKKRLCSNKEVIVLGELEELQTSVWGVLKKNDKGLGFEFLKGKL
jgi:LysR family transcriptional activator of nhaA